MKRPAGSGLERGGVHAKHPLQQALEEPGSRHRPAAVETKDEFSEVCRQMPGPWSSPVGFRQPTLEQGGDTMDPGQLPTTLAGHRPVAGSLPVAAEPQAPRQHHAAGLDGTGQETVDGGAAATRAAQPDADRSFPLLRRRNQDPYLLPPGSGALAGPRVSPKDLVHLDPSLQPIPRAPGHGPANPMQQTPRRAVVAEAQHPLQFPRADPVPPRGHVPDRPQPDARRNMAALECGARQDRDLSPTTRAQPEPSSGRPRPLSPAAWTTKSPGPANPKKHPSTRFIRAKLPPCHRRLPSQARFHGTYHAQSRAGPVEVQCHGPADPRAVSA